ncbi:NADP-dependent oxidoreductase domain-containing protein [Aspergillus cavernicola]|uniref:NADP-dependent oxidoreductase domain-containing protein n=1 Tax=Aspergillus cavernicola TaxID=176166 RepID=A0ABR4HNZ2_9EURO
MSLPVHPPARSPLDRHRQLAPSAAVRVSPLCLGAMNFGDVWERLGECPKETAFEILEGNGLPRGETVMHSSSPPSSPAATKNHENDKLQSNYGRNSAKSMHVSLDLSLRKLRTSYIDLSYLHWWDYSVSIPELMHSLNNLVVTGKVIYLGFSVYHGLWNTSIRDFEREVLPICRDENMGNNPRCKGQPPLDDEKHVSKALETIANSKETDLTSVVLAYICHKAPYVFLIVGGRKFEHLRGNIAALDLSLTYSFDHGIPHTFLSGTLFDNSPPCGPDSPGGVWLTKLMGNFDWVQPGLQWTK